MATKRGREYLEVLDPSDLMSEQGHLSGDKTGVKASKRITQETRREAVAPPDGEEKRLKQRPKYRRKKKKNEATPAKKDVEKYDPTFYNPMYPRENDVRVRDIPLSEIPPQLREKALKGNWTIERLNKEIRIAFAFYFTGSIPQTLYLMEDDGWGPWLPPRPTARGWLWLPEVRAVLETRLYNVPGYKKGIATREELQIFWTQVVRDEKKDIKFRLDASKYLAQSHAMFIERKELGLTVTLKDLLEEVETMAEAQVVKTVPMVEEE